MNKIKSWSLATCVALSSFALFGTSVLAAPAIVQSDPNLNFDNVKLQQTLTNISDKNKQLNITFYSLNNIDDTKAIVTNDNFISSGTINTNDYVTLVFNRNVNYPSKGSFSANIGANYRDYITKNEISDEIVQPNIKKYLPQNPQGFIVVVAEQISDKIQAKKCWNDFVAFSTKVAMIVFFGGLLFVFVYLSIKALVEHLKESLEQYKMYQGFLEQVNNSYTKLLEQSTYLTGYIGATAEKANQFLSKINSVNDEYLTLKGLPKFINVILRNPTWFRYTQKLSSFKEQLDILLDVINKFLTSIEGRSGTDPLAEVLALQKQQEETKQYNNLLVEANKLYNGGLEYTEQSQVHSMFKQVQDAKDITSRTLVYNQFNQVATEELKLINRLSKLKNSVKEVADYIVNNNNNYYTNINVFSNSDKEWAKNFLIRAINHNNYYDLETIKDIEQELNFFVIEYKQQDAQYRVTNERKASLINKVNIIVPTKFVLIQDRLLKQIREVTINSDYNLAEKTLNRLETEVNTLIKDAKAYKSRQAKLANYSGTRKTELTKQLDNNNYSNFDVLIVNYNDEDERTKRASYSLSSYSSYNSSPSNSNDSSSYSSSSSSSSWSNSSSDDSYSSSSSSSDDSSNSSSSSDDSW